MEEDSRRSTAAQFFEEEMAEPKPEQKSTSTYDRVVELLNNASLMQKDSMKVSLLKQVQEFIIHKEPNLLDNFLDEMIAFQSDRSVDVRKYIVGFMEEACKKESELLFKVLPSLMLMLQDENINVQKRVMLSMAQLYRITLQWLSTSKGISSEMTLVWDKINAMKGIIFEMLDSENDGVRTHVVKFLEGVVLILTTKTKESEVPKKQENDFTIDDIKESNRYIKIKKLEEEAKVSMDALLHFQASPHISSINLMTVMGALSNIAKQRPVYFSRVVQAFEALHVNLPPTLAKSQVSSVRKNLKMHMLALLKHSMSVDFIPQITTLLTDLGATHNEIQKVMPKIDESKKRKADETTTSTKKLKLEEEEIDLDDDDIGMTPFVKRGERKPATLAQRQTAIDITAEDILDRLTPQNVADLVLISMVMLPDNMPAQFQATYTPIAAAGTDAQVKHLARLLATQLTTAGMGKGILAIQSKELDMDVEEEEGDATPLPPSPKQLIQTLVGGTTLHVADTKEVSSPLMLPPTAAPRKGIKQFKLSAVTHVMDRDALDQMTTLTFKRILHAEKTAKAGNALANRVKILASLVCQFGGELKDILQEYIFEDLRNRADIAFSWLYQEYANCRGFSATTIAGEKSTLASYDECLTRLLSGLLDRPDHREGLFTRLILESPVITDNAMQVLKKYCMDENRVTTGMYTLRDLVLTRPAHRLRYLDVLLEFVSVEKQEVRTAAIRTVKKLYERPSLKDAIENYSMKCLKNLLKPKPPAEMFPNIKVKQDIPDSWIEEAIKKCLYLYLGLLPSNHRMIHELAIVYTATSADIKRTILRVLETPVKGMGMDSPELLLLVENCPKGAETLVTRIIHILTDKAAPSPELVERVRDLYHKRVSDVRFLIPVLTGLHKKEVIAALPKLIKLNPIVVKEVFNRLLGGHGDGGATYTSPLNPAELLIALHNIDANKCDMKTIIKATNLCFAEKIVYTQEVLAVVMQQLMEQNPLPTLFMRTVLQSLSMCPRLIGFVMNILQRLIIKQVWKQKKVWEGFIKCCQRTKPQSFQVLLQLPTSQLKNVFEVSPELREPLLNHINSFTPHQRAHIPKSIITVLETDPVQEQKQAEAAAKVEDFVNMTSTPVIIDLLPEDSEPVPPGLEMAPSNVLIPLGEIKQEPVDEIEKPKTVITIPIKKEKLSNFPTTPIDITMDTNFGDVSFSNPESTDIGISSQSDADISMTSGPEPGELTQEEMGSQDSETIQSSQEGKPTSKRKETETSPKSKESSKRGKKKSTSASEPVRRSSRSRKA